MFPRWFAGLFALALVLAACGGSEEIAEPELADTAEVSEPADETNADSEQAEEPEAPTTTVDERTDRERAIDQLDLMLLQLGATDLVSTADCVVERLDEEGIEIVGQGAPEIAASLACDRVLGDQLFGAESFDLPEEDGQCFVEGLIDAIIDTPLSEVETFFAAATPPAEALETISSDCGVTLEQLNSGFG